MRAPYVHVVMTLSLVFTGVQVMADRKKSDILDQRQELDGIKKEVEEGRRRLDSLQNVEASVTKRISEYDQKISSERKIIGRLNNELRQLQNDIAAASENLDDSEVELDRRRRRYLGSLRQFYYAAIDGNSNLAIEPNKELEKHRQIIYLTALASYQSENVAQASDLLARASDDLDELSGRNKMVTKLKKSKETSVALETSQRSKQQKNLDVIKRTSREEFDRVLTLQKAAEEMENIIARLEQERRRDTPSGRQQTGSSVFATLKGQLPPPYRGTIIVKYGNATDPVTKLKSFSPGITIKGAAGRSVATVASGTVAYAGELRGYGNFVIINHDNQYYTTYAGLGDVLVSEGQYVQSRTKIGSAASDGLVKFELRKGREPLDPVEWMKIEAL